MRYLPKGRWMEAIGIAILSMWIGGCSKGNMDLATSDGSQTNSSVEAALSDGQVTPEQNARIMAALSSTSIPASFAILGVNNPSLGDTTVDNYLAKGVAGLYHWEAKPGKYYSLILKSLNNNSVNYSLYTISSSPVFLPVALDRGGTYKLIVLEKNTPDGEFTGVASNNPFIFSVSPLIAPQNVYSPDNGICKFSNSQKYQFVGLGFFGGDYTLGEIELLRETPCMSRHACETLIGAHITGSSATHSGNCIFGGPCTERGTLMTSLASIPAAYRNRPDTNFRGTTFRPPFNSAGTKDLGVVNQCDPKVNPSALHLVDSDVDGYVQQLKSSGFFIPIPQ